MEEPLLAALLAGVPLPAFLVGAEERVMLGNPASLALLGEEAIGRRLALVIRAPALLDAVSAVLAGGAAREAELRMTDDSHFRATVSPVGERALCVLRDISSEIHSEAIRRDFVANVSHELRTPLTALMGFIETLRSSARDDAAARERFLAIMEREAARMNRLVRDLLQLSRVEAEERVRPRAPVDLGALLHGVLATMRPVAQAQGARIEFSGAAAPVIVPGDADQLTQVFLNLVENAMKYGHAGQTIRISLSLEEGVPERVRVAVADEGEGIEPIHLPRLTERFYRVDAHRSRAGGGTGLGLAIVKHVIQRHRGQLKITSRRGEGSVFAVILPLS